MNIAVDVNASFNTLGDIKPLYLRIENENHEINTYKLTLIKTKSENYSGINAIVYICSIVIEDTIKEIKLKFYVNSHKWVLVN